MKRFFVVSGFNERRSSCSKDALAGSPARALAESFPTQTSSYLSELSSRESSVVKEIESNGLGSVIQVASQL